MARRVGLPQPSTSPFGGGGGGFGAYDVLSSGRGENIEWQKAQARWAAGKISNDAYVAEWQKYINTLDTGSSAYVNAVQGLRQQKYVFARDDIVTRIENADPDSQRYVNAWEDLLAYDRKALDGMVINNEEYRQRVDRLRQTQSGLFQVGYKKVAAKYAAQEMNTRQLREWYQSQLSSDLVAGNPELRSTIRQSIEELRTREASERRTEVYNQWRDDKMPPEEFIAYATSQIAAMPSGSPEAEEWRGYIQQARIEMRTASMEYRWNLSARYRELQTYLADPSNSPKGKTTGTRTILRDGKWVEVPVTEAPSASDVAAYDQRQQDIAAWKEEMTRIERRIAATGDGFVTPGDMLAFYRKQLSKYAPGTDSYFAVQANIDKYEDMADLWKAQDTMGKGAFVTPDKPLIQIDPKTVAGMGLDGQANNNSGGGAALPGEKGMNIETFLSALSGVESGGDYRAVNSSSGARGKYQIMPANWPSWARKYLGDASAKWTPENQEAVARGKALDLYKWLGSWARVAYWWLTGDGKTTDTNQWSQTAQWYVNKVMTGAGGTRLPKGWDFGYTIPRNPRQPVPTGVYAGEPRYGWGGRTDRGEGANLTDLSAGAAAYGINFSDRNSSWFDVVRALKNGKGAVLQGYAMVFQHTGQGSDMWDPGYTAKGLDTDHSVAIWGYRIRNGKEQILWLDPLGTDGHGGQWVDAALVKRFATTFSGGASRVSVAISPRRIPVAPTIVTERESGPWTGCTWAAGATIINGIKGRRVANMADIRAYGESGQYQGNYFSTHRGMVDGTDDGRVGEDGRKPKKDPANGKTPSLVVSVEGGQPVVPGPQAGEQGGGNVGTAPDGGWTWPAAEAPGQGTEQGPLGPMGPQLPGSVQPKAKPVIRQPDFYTVEDAPFPGAPAGPRPGRLKDGTTPGAFENFYQAYQKAYLRGDTSFIYTDPSGRTSNYFVGDGDPAFRQKMMEGLDAQRISLTQGKWQRLVNDPNADPDKLDEARRKYDGAVNDAAQNAFEALLMGQGTTEDKPNAVNANPAADMLRVGAGVKEAIALHYQTALKYWKSGQETSAYAELQAASDLIESVKEPMAGLAGQVQGTLDAWAADGRVPDDKTQAELDKALDWTTGAGLDVVGADGTLSNKDMDKLLGDISSVVKMGPNGEPMVNKADGQFILQDGVYRIIKPSTDPASDDTVDYVRERGKNVREPDGTLTRGFGLDDHVATKVFVNGRWIMAQAPWETGIVGQVIDAAGNRWDLLGKEVDVRLGGRSYTQFEQPLAPGRWSGTPAIYKAPSTFTAEQADDGSMRYFWIGDDGRRYSLGFNPNTGSYDLYHQEKKGGFGDMGAEWGEPVMDGPLAGNQMIQQGLGWERDLGGLSTEDRFAADSEGATVGIDAKGLIADYLGAKLRTAALARLTLDQQRIAAQTDIWNRQQTPAPPPQPKFGGFGPQGQAGQINPGYSSGIPGPKGPQATPTPTTAPTSTSNPFGPQGPQGPQAPTPTPAPSSTKGPQAAGSAKKSTPPPRNASSDDIITSTPPPPAPVPKPKPKQEPDNTPLPRVPTGGTGPIKS